ncbi:Asp/Glu racemase [Neolentinus lepideus HHB14362 ss-1]|uniref:Asp/Glu racemase n=1 Tax=Neolentinus lepideus HHB14362 ss-1 TaxID=1314782 RepID=A0A165P1X0_9AGAM|nr:Asp/Glu racemase [Neolentinus lepideus HHB14362 ss-1]
MTDNSMKSLASLRDLKKIGFIVPSSNTALEPITAHIIAHQLAGRVSVHFSRVAVRTLDTDEESVAQFGTEKMLASAALLADADLDAILWNGTAASWSGKGMQADIELAEEITRATGLPCSTSTLAQVEVLEAYGVKQLALAGPYGDGPMRGLVAFYEGLGYAVVGTAQMGARENVVFGNTPLERIRELIRAADRPEAECVVVACTNWPAALVVEEMEAALGKPVYDSVCVTLWAAMRAVGVGVPLFGWGKLLRDDPALREADAVMEALLGACAASRVTLRLDVPRWNCHVDAVCAEACARGVASLRLDASLNQRAMRTVQWLERTRAVLVQGDLAATEVEPPKALVDVYGVRAQMLAPLVRGEEVYGWVSVHQVGRTRVWTEGEVGELRGAVERVEGILAAHGWI